MAETSAERPTALRARCLRPGQAGRDRRKSGQPSDAWREEGVARDVAAAVAHVGRRASLDAAVEGQLELHAARIVHEQLPERGAGHEELAPVEVRRAESLAELVEAVRGEREMVDGAGAGRRLALTTERGAAGVDVHDRVAARRGTREPRAGIAEVRSEERRVGEEGGGRAGARRVREDG